MDKRTCQEPGGSELQYLRSTMAAGELPPLTSKASIRTRNRYRAAALPLAWLKVIYRDGKRAGTGSSK